MAGRVAHHRQHIHGQDVVSIKTLNCHFAVETVGWDRIEQLEVNKGT